ncbi:hypothetical protein ASG90_05890 [Nocardioides sp. Soil797]|nr:hypothetical protein ASG90_05890 [Nocardioides sp. Soil797]
MSRRKMRSDDGAAAVEFALVFPILVLILFGIINYSYMFTVRQALTQSSAEGARAGAVVQAADGVTPEQAAKNAVNEALDGFGFDCGDGELSCATSTAACGGGNAAQCVTVKVTLTRSAYRLIDLPLTPMGDTMTFTSSAEVN